MAYTFSGGIHPDDQKSYTNHVPITVLDGVGEHVFPIACSISGRRLMPVVEIGAHVKVGTKIADAEAFVSVPLHSSVSGTVKAIEKRLHPSGVPVMSVVVENDGLYELDEHVRPKGKLTDLSPDDIRKNVREAGSSAGGAGFPTHVSFRRQRRRRSST